MKDRRNKIYKESKLTVGKQFDLKEMIEMFRFKVEEQLKIVLDKKTLKTSNINKIARERKAQNNEEYSKIGNWAYYHNNSILEWSPETFRIFDYPKDYQGTLLEFYLSSIDEKTIVRFPEILEIFHGEEGSNVMSQTIITPSGEKKQLSFTSFPLLDDNGELIGIEGDVIDVTDEISGKSGLNNFFSMSSDLHCITHLDTYFLKVSPAWVKLLGYTEEELLSRSYLNIIHPDDFEDSYGAVVEVDKSDDSLVFENRYIKKSGEVVYLSWRARIDPETDLGYCTARDITKSKLVEKGLLSDLSEKELLLREIHHRVKNNLQIISSLLSLQAGRNSDQKELFRLYEDSKNRIQSMAVIHEMFYLSEELDKIEFGMYLNKLIEDLSRSFSTQDKSISFSLDIDSIHVNLDTAIPLGLLINEVVTNSIKHGADDLGNINIFSAIEALDDDKLELTIGDNGCNSMKNVLDFAGESLGVLLINSLVEQIDGEIEQLENTKGTVFKLTFRNKKNRKV
jgi:PAS domain S-box-containing protein